MMGRKHGGFLRLSTSVPRSSPVHSQISRYKKKSIASSPIAQTKVEQHPNSSYGQPTSTKRNETAGRSSVVDRSVGPRAARAKRRFLFFESRDRSTSMWGYRRRRSYIAPPPTQSARRRSGGGAGGGGGIVQQPEWDVSVVVVVVVARCCCCRCRCFFLRPALFFVVRAPSLHQHLFPFLIHQTTTTSTTTSTCPLLHRARSTTSGR